MCICKDRGYILLTRSSIATLIDEIEIIKRSREGIQGKRQDGNRNIGETYRGENVDGHRETDNHFECMRNSVVYLFLS